MPEHFGNADAVIAMDAVSRVFKMGHDEIHAVDGVCFTARAGEFIAIMGPSGSGKSTLMNLIGCLDTPSGGHYCLAGRPVDGLDDDALSELRNRHVGFVFQSFHLLPRLDAEQNVALPLVYARVDAEKRSERARELLELVGLGDRRRHRPDELSGGQRQRVAIARALVRDPQLILADEPTGNLDSETSREILDLFGRLHAAGRTIVLVTHDPEVAARADRVLHMRDGKIAEETCRA